MQSSMQMRSSMLTSCDHWLASLVFFFLAIVQCHAPKEGSSPRVFDTKVQCGSGLGQEADDTGGATDGRLALASVA